MPQIRATDFIRDLKQSHPATKLPFIFLYGDEPFLVEEVQQRLLKEVLPKPNDFNFARFFAGDVASQDILDSLFILPFGCPRRVVLVKGCEDLAFDDFLPYLASPAEASLLVMVSAAGIDLRRKFFKVLAEKGLLIDAGKLSGEEVLPWVKHFGKKRGLGWNGMEVSHLIHQMVGDSLSALDQALERLFLFHGEKADLSKADVLAVLSDTRDGYVFSLTDALGRGDRYAAYLNVKRLLRDHDLSVFISTLAALNQFYRRLLWIRTGMARKCSDAELQKVAGISPGALYFNKKIASGLSLAKLKANLTVLQEADVGLKTSRLPKDLLLYRTIDRLLQ